MESEGLVLPILVQSRLEVAAAFVAGEAECLSFLRLLDCEDDELGWWLLPIHFTGETPPRSATAEAGAMERFACPWSIR